jgi:hypothetical protein
MASRCSSRGRLLGRGRVYATVVVVDVRGPRRLGILQGQNYYFRDCDAPGYNGGDAEESRVGDKSIAVQWAAARRGLGPVGRLLWWEMIEFWWP